MMGILRWLMIALLELALPSRKWIPVVMDGEVRVRITPAGREALEEARQAER
jgi:hypothetical protein